MKNLIKKILLEERKTQYQVRDIGGSVYYKKEGGEKWKIIDEIEFYKNSNKNNTVDWKEKKSKKDNDIRQVEVPTNIKDKMEYFKVFYENLSPSKFDVKVDGNFVKIQIK